MSSSQAEPQPLPPEDWVAIQQLLARYCHAIDGGDHDGWAACFAPDGVFAIGGGRELAGRAQLAAFAREIGAGERLRHWPGPPVVRAFDGLTATVEAYQLTLALPADGRGQATIRRVATPRSQLVKRDGRWWIARREARVHAEL